VLVDEDGAIWFRQSWLETAMRCNERGRLALVKPEFDSAIGDTALIGTAAHAAIAEVLTANDGVSNEIGPRARHHALALCDEHEVYWTKWTLPTHLADHASRCAEAWAREIMPCVRPGGLVEVDFTVPLFESRGRTIGIKGTIDYASPDGTLWDWKTASKKYEQREKQRVAIQPTVYATAAMHGVLGDTPYRYPIRFHYGVMVRGDARATTQIVDVQRSHAHEAWLLDHLNTYVDLADALGVFRSWPRNEDHYLCNETWCPWWSICKGARLSAAQNAWRG
jgi:PD-(D/E)XK nuclease superfamily